MRRTSENGFTFAELMVVCTIMGLILALSLPLGKEWLENYRYSAACRSFYNALHLAKINAMSGASLFNIVEIDKGAAANEFKVTTGPFVFNCDESATIYDQKGYPVNLGSFIILDGFVDPYYVNGNVFRVSSQPTVKQVSSLGDGRCKAELIITLSSSKVVWSPAPSVAIASATGRAWTAAVATFIPQSETYDRTTYYVEKQLNIDTVRCEFDPSYYYIEVNGVSVESGSADSVVFDSSGCPKDLQPYTVTIRRKKNGAVSDAQPPFVIRVESSGKIYSG